jgi:hypothetical protein
MHQILNPQADGIILNKLYFDVFVLFYRVRIIYTFLTFI